MGGLSLLRIQFSAVVPVGERKLSPLADKPFPGTLLSCQSGGVKKQKNLHDSQLTTAERTIRFRLPKLM